MSIASQDQLIAAPKQRLSYDKTGSGGRTTVAGAWFSLFDLAGSPGAGTLAIGNTANGLVPVDTTAGYPIINAFGGGATGYLSGVVASNTVVSRLRFFDRVFAAGAFAFGTPVTLASQPSYSSRVPGGGTDFTGLELWIECVTAFTGNLSVAVTYTDQSGNTGHTTGTFATGTALTVGRCMQLNLAAGDSGIQKIESVTPSVASAGTFNVMVLRPIFDAPCDVAGLSRIWDWTATQLPVVFTDSAIYALAYSPSGTASGVPYCDLVVANG